MTDSRQDPTLGRQDSAEASATPANRTAGTPRTSEERLRALLEISQALAAPFHLDTILQLVVDNATKLLDLDTGALYLTDGDDVVLVATCPPLPPAFPDPLRRAPLREHPHIRSSLESGTAVVLSDTQTETLTSAERQVVDARGLRTILYLPLMVGTHPTGTLILASTGTPRTFEADDIAVCQGFSGHAAQTIENARLYESTRRFAEALEREVEQRKHTEEERHALQARLTQAEKMESIGRLAGGVAHDFNNMIQAIIGNTGLVLEDLPLDSPFRENLEEVSKAAERSADLTRQLLAFARQQTIEPTVIDLNATVNGMLRMLRRLIGEGITLAWLPGTHLSPVRMDPSQIDQLIANLCVNAKDAIGDRAGRITIETRTVTVDDSLPVGPDKRAPGEYVVLSVRDDGCGMDADTLAHIFEPFFTTKGIGKGTGLGLATIYGVVEQNRGFITVSTELNVGTTLCVHLPAFQGDASPAGRRETARPAARGAGTILLVEDDPSVLHSTKIMLERMGYRVLPAGSPGDAIRLAEERKQPIDCLLTDVVMPEMNGRDLATHLLRLCPGLRCLFMSGYTDDVVTRRGVLNEGLRFIQKPFSSQDLAAKLAGMRTNGRPHT